MGRVLVIGIDSLDADLLRRFLPDLPNLRRLMAPAGPVPYRSVYPPDSHTCWASIYTGLNPAQHGILYFRDPLDKVSHVLYIEIDNAPIRGRTFWDVAGHLGYRVCVVFPHVGYPPWSVNGAMIGRSNEVDVRANPILVEPPGLLDPGELTHLNIIKGLPPRGAYGAYLGRWKRLVHDEVALCKRLMGDLDWDLFFTYSSAADWVQHNTWMYFDEGDPSHPGPNPFANAIPDVYRWYDEAIGELVGAAGPDTSVVIVSDHGHGRRPGRLVNVNEYLRGQGYLRTKFDAPGTGGAYVVLEAAKRRVTQLVNRYTQAGLGKLATVVLRAWPEARRLYTSPPSIDWASTQAYVSDLSGIKAYTYGGVVINRALVHDGAYEDLRGRLIGEIGALREPTTGEALVEWIAPREALYHGPHLDRYPDILFEFRGDYGAGWSVGAPLVTPCYTHNIQPGSHRAQSPVLILSNAPGVTPGRIAGPMDIAPTILHILTGRSVGLPGGDGQTLLAPGGVRVPAQGGRP